MPLRVVAHALPRDLGVERAPVTTVPRRAIFGVALAACAAPLLWAAWSEHGAFWPDEVLQTLEQGHRAAFGYGLVPWEFRDGARSWLVPGAIAVVMKVGAACGVESGLGLARLVKACFALGTIAGGWATMRLAERFGGLLAAAFAGALYASCPLVVYFGSRCLTDTASIPLVAFGALLAASPAQARLLYARRVAAGVLFGLATIVRPQNGILGAVALGVLVVARSWTGSRAFVIGGAAALVAGGLLDWATWGAPFHSLVVNVRYNLVEGKASSYGTEPALYYANVLYTAAGWPMILVALGAIASVPRAPSLVAAVVVFGGAHVIVPHKELRFLLPIVPLALAASAIGIAGVLGRVDRLARANGAASWVLVGSLAIAVVAMGAVKLSKATFASMGYLEKGDLAAWHHDEVPTLLFSRVGRRPDVCGVIYASRWGGWGHTGGFSYLHRDVPFFRTDSPRADYANYVVAPRGARVRADFEEVETLDTHVLYRRPGTCAPPPPDYTRESEK